MVIKYCPIRSGTTTGVQCKTDLCNWNVVIDGENRCAAMNKDITIEQALKKISSYCTNNVCSECKIKGIIKCKYEPPYGLDGNIPIPVKWRLGEELPKKCRYINAECIKSCLDCNERSEAA
jgi:hypothetical protein